MSFPSSPSTRVGILLAGYALVGSLVFLAGLHTPLAAEPRPVRSGAEVWRQNNCQACHAVYGLGGHLGPDLTNFMRRRGEDYARVALLAGRPGMPIQTLAAGELDALMAYLGALDRSGRYPLSGKHRPAMGDLP